MYINRRLKRPGVSMTELLFVIPLSLVIIAAVLQLMFFSVSSFERIEDLTALTGWSSAEKLFSFLGTAVRHSGIGLPDRWEKELFSGQTNLSSIPAWALWKKPVSVGNSISGYSFTDSSGEWGNTLRLVYGVPVEIILTETLSLTAFEKRSAVFSGNVGISGKLGATKSGSWILFPGTLVPVLVTGDGNSANPTVCSQQDTYVPWGTPPCRLMAVSLYVSGQTLFANFHDESGAQPLLKNVSAVEFRLEGAEVLHVKVKFLMNSGVKMEESRSWRIAT